MRKISIARRRIETTGQKPLIYPSKGSEPKNFPFDRKVESSSLLMNFPGRLSFQPPHAAGPEAIEIVLNKEQMDSVNPFLTSGRLRQVSGSLLREREGVLYLNLELSPKNPPRYLSAKTIAGMLEISPRTVYRLHKKNRLPGIRIGRTLRFSFGDVMDYLGSCAEELEG
jgi:excisionase family DNA binding protein